MPNAARPYFLYLYIYVYVYNLYFIYILVHDKYTNEEEPLELKHLVGDVCLKNTVP